MRRALLPIVVLAAAACGSGWSSADTKSATDATNLGKACDRLCLSDAGCSATVAAGCFESITCNVGSMLPRHGAPDLLDGGAALGCGP